MAETQSPVATSTSNSRASKYRPEIDGLRAFAVVAVIINHFNKDLLPSGYLGVDIFFVISGYVITSSLAGRESKNFLDFLTGFYERRIKRLVPALVVFVLVTTVGTTLFIPDPKVAIKTGITSLFGVSNLYLYNQSTDYFAQSTELNPFTHTWSLGVEEQFYLLFPFLIWFSGFGQQTAKGARNLFFWVGALTIASLIGFIYLYRVKQPAAYFLMPPRFWEMAAGCLLFIGFQKRVSIEQALERVPPLLIVGAMVGMMLSPLSKAVPATIGVVVLSAILIACLKKGTAAYRFFTLEKVVHIGLISYSLYLWHWTVLSISRWTIGIHWWSVPIQAIAIYLVALISFNFIERPARKLSAISRATMLLASALSSVSALTVTFALMQYSENIYSGERLESQQEEASPVFKDCALSKQHRNKLKIMCGFQQSNANAKRVFLLGDSHIEQFAEAALLDFSSKGYSVYLAWDGSCPFPITKEIYANEECQSNQTLVEKQIAHSIMPGDIVVIGNAVNGYFLPYNWQAEGHDYRHLKSGVNVQVAINSHALKTIDIAERVVERGGKVAIYLDGPRFNGIKDARLCSKEWFRFDTLSPLCRINKNKYLNWRASVFKRYIEWADGKSRILLDGVTIEDCPNEYCVATNFYDSNHFTRRHARTVFRDFAKRLDF